MKNEITKFSINLMLLAGDSSNEKEQTFIRMLEDLLRQAEKGQQLDGSLLDKANHKVCLVACYSEKYMDIVWFLNNYKKSYVPIGEAA